MAEIDAGNGRLTKGTETLVSRRAHARFEMPTPKNFGGMAKNVWEKKSKWPTKCTQWPQNALNESWNKSTSNGWIWRWSDKRCDLQSQKCHFDDRWRSNANFWNFDIEISRKRSVWAKNCYRPFESSCSQEYVGIISDPNSTGSRPYCEKKKNNKMASKSAILNLNGKTKTEIF